MDRFDGTAARQLDLIDQEAASRPVVGGPVPRRPPLRLLRRDIYAELARRRRRAQIHARHLLDQE